MKTTVVLILFLSVFILKGQTSRSRSDLERGEREVREIMRRITEEHLPVFKSDINDLSADFSYELRKKLNDFSTSVADMSLYEAQTKIIAIHKITEQEMNINTEKLERANAGYNIILCLCALISLIILF